MMKARSQAFSVLVVRKLRFALLGVGLLWTSALCQPSRSAAAEPVSSDFAAQLAAGEFAPALETAKQTADRETRDARFAQIAAAQSDVGSCETAFHTLLHIEDDRSRTAAIAETQKRLAKNGAAGGAQADFDSLMDLITSTVSPQSWDDVGGGGSISPFRNGVYVDVEGVLRRAVSEKKATGLATTRLAALRGDGNVDPRLYSRLRKVSLTRLEKHVQIALASGRTLNDEMLNLAGLEKIQFVLLYPETGDLVIAGPAGSWHTDDRGRVRSRHTGRPVLQLDDLVTLLRVYGQSPQAILGCSIDPTQDGLARTKQFAEASSKRPIKPSQRTAWLKKLCDQMGLQTISVDGVDPRSRVARVLVEADYHMKLIGMGLEPGLVEVPSYLDLVRVEPGEPAPPLDVLRWWFTLEYQSIEASRDRDAFEFRGSGVKLLSENEFLTSLGQRVHTGESNVTNQDFTDRFNRHFATLAEKYPIYADLQNVFDLALVSALIGHQNLAGRAGWHQLCFSDPSTYQVKLGIAPQSVESVINHRRVNGNHLIIGVSGGVHAQPGTFVENVRVETPGEGSLQSRRKRWASTDLPLESWWWD